MFLGPIGILVVAFDGQGVSSSHVANVCLCARGDDNNSTWKHKVEECCPSID